MLFRSLWIRCVLPLLGASVPGPSRSLPLSVLLELLAGPLLGGLDPSLNLVDPLLDLLLLELQERLLLHSGLKFFLDFLNSLLVLVQHLLDLLDVV